MERVEERTSRPWPELALIACGLILILVVAFRSSTPSCHHWKQRLGDVSAAFMGAAGTEEHPQSWRPAEDDHATLSRAARRVIDDRPFACL
jgi:hypothetical protein